MSDPAKIVRTKEFAAALKAMDAGDPFTFITGRAGTGKSTLLREFRKETKSRCAVLAPTGVAALNVQGETIHGFFRFSPGISVRDARKKGASAADELLYRTLEVLVVDEISMVRADLFDAMDSFLRAARRNNAPFGGLRIVAIGDLYQLPPVVGQEEREEFAKAYDTSFFFGANAFSELIQRREVGVIELERVFRQKDPKFIELLNAVRTRGVQAEHLDLLRSRVVTRRKDAVVLTSTNRAADDLNATRLDSLPGHPTAYDGYAQGSFGEKDMPAAPRLLLKPGARVMFTANDAEGRYVNGTVGTIEGCFKNRVAIKTDEGERIDVGMHTWTLFRSVYDNSSRSLAQEKVGSFSQYPLRLAWAVTIHKSQGKTFDHVHVDLGRGAFASGQVYVGLSRARSIDGLTLASPVERRHILVDPSVTEFFAELPEMLKSGARKGGNTTMDF